MQAQVQAQVQTQVQEQVQLLASLVRVGWGILTYAEHNVRRGPGWVQTPKQKEAFRAEMPLFCLFWDGLNIETIMCQEILTYAEHNFRRRSRST